MGAPRLRKASEDVGGMRPRAYLDEQIGEQQDQDSRDPRLSLQSSDDTDTLNQDAFILKGRGQLAALARAANNGQRRVTQEQAPPMPPQHQALFARITQGPAPYRRGPDENVHVVRRGKYSEPDAEYSPWLTGRLQASGRPHQAVRSRAGGHPAPA